MMRYEDTNWYGVRPPEREPTFTPTVAPAAAPAAPVNTGFQVELNPNLPEPGRSGGPRLSPSQKIVNAPGFVAPEFQAPTWQSLQEDPGYQFRLNAGQGALERSAAARGVLRTGGTLKDILEYGQNFAGQEYENAYNRALGAYDRKFQAAQAAYAPRFAQWQLGAEADLAGGRGGGGGGGFDVPPPPSAPGPYEY